MPSPLYQKQTRASHIKRTYGLVWEQYESLYAKQKGCCAICRHPISMYKDYNDYEVAAVDHCHKTGKVRGLLCNQCNKAIGHLRDNPMLCRITADYLEEHENDN